LAIFYDRAADLIRKIYDSRIQAPPVLDLDRHFPGGLKFARAWPEIRSEALDVARRLSQVPRFHEIMKEQTAISANDGRDWRMFILKAYGIANPPNMALCPVLAAIAAASPEVLSVSISFLAPGKHIPSHRGPFRGVLRFYLVLSMPLAADGRPAAVLRVNGADYRLRDGEFLLWDDTFPHEVWNNSGEVRAVLLLDVKRREMPVDMKIFSQFLMMIVRMGIRVRGFA
jgi:aspartate beta-hydroxylase